MWSSPLFNIMVFVVLYAIAKIIADKTKGLLLEPLTLSVIYLVGFLTGIIPKGGMELTGMPMMVSAFGLMLVVTNLGTAIELRRLFREWRTVVICVGSMLIMAALFCLVGIPLFGREFALCALPPVAGGVVANTMVISTAEAAGRPEFGAFSSLVVSTQVFASIPIATIMLRKYCYKIYDDKSFLLDPLAGAKAWPDFRLIKSWPKVCNDTIVIVARLMIVCFIGTLVSQLTGGTIPAAIVVLILGIIFTEIGFLERQTLAKAGYFNFLMLGLFMTIPLSYQALTVESLLSMLAPVVFFLVLGAVGLSVGGIIFGKLVKVNWRLSIALALSAMFGYPLTEIIARSVVSTMHLPPEEEAKMLNSVMPQLIVAGFTTVSIASVLLAGVVAPAIFR